MPLESDIATALGPLFSGRIFPDTADHDTPRPFCIYQHIGGAPVQTFCGETDRKNEVVQFVVWANTRLQVNALMRSMAVVLTAPTVGGATVGGFTAIYDEPTRSRGARQDFSFWR